jgi:hypothetical protein
VADGAITEKDRPRVSRTLRSGHRAGRRLRGTSRQPAGAAPAGGTAQASTARAGDGPKQEAAA